MSERVTAGPDTLSNPYPGLRPFRSDEKHLFFGRERQVDRMIGKLAANRLLAVVGGSGSGKSSLVNCGLRPALHRGSLSGAGAAWRMAQLRPGGDPIGALARALGEPGVLFDDALTGALTTAQLVESTLRLGPLGLVDIVEQADLPPGTNLLVVADQFEELFRFRGLQPGPAPARHDAYTPPEDAQAFVSLLLAAAAQAALPIYVVLTMRSDFMGDCAQFDGLPEALNEGQYLVPRMSRSEIRAAISGPAAVSGRRLSPVLVTRLLNDVGDNPDQLSILQHALNRTWAHWQHEGQAKGDLDLPDYQAIGRMERALDNHAEKAFDELGSGERQALAAKIFKALTDRTTDARGTRRPTTLGTLAAITGATTAELVSVIDVFRKPSRSFLMPPVPEALAADTVIDISHESLMRIWKRLRDWSEQEAVSSAIYVRLAERASRHARQKADLYTQRELDEALQWRGAAVPTAAWAGRLPGDFVQAMHFLDDSHAHNAAIRAERDRRRRLRAGVIGAALLVMLAISTNWVSVESSRLNERIRDANAVLANLAAAAQMPDKCKGRAIDADADGKPDLSAKVALYLHYLAELCAQTASPSASDADGARGAGFRAVAAALHSGDLAATSRALARIQDETARRAAETMIDQVLDLHTPEIARERQRLAALGAKGSVHKRRLESVGAPVGAGSAAFRHPVHQRIAGKLGQPAGDTGKSPSGAAARLTEDEACLIEAYETLADPSREPSPAADPTPAEAVPGAAKPEAASCAERQDGWNRAAALYSETEMHRRMVQAAKRPESAFTELRTKLTTYAWLSLLLLPWPAWKAWRFWQRSQRRPVPERPAALRLGLAAMADLAVTVGLTMASTALIDSTETIFKRNWSDGAAFVVALTLALLPGLLYALLRDAIHLRHCRSFGKIAFDLRPVTLGPAPEGHIDLGASIRRNAPLVALLVLWVGTDAVLIATDLEPVIATMVAGGAVVVLALTTLRDRVDRWTRTRVIDADCDLSQRIDRPPRYLEGEPAATPVAQRPDVPSSLAPARHATPGSTS